MSEKTIAELCEEAINGWKKTTDEIVPMYCYAGFMYGILNKKQRKEVDKKLGKNNLIRAYIKEGIKKYNTAHCKKCKKQLEPEDKFCSNCGKKAGSE